MQKIEIDKTSQLLRLYDFEPSINELTIKVFGTDPPRIVMFPGNKLTLPNDRLVTVQNCVISDPEVYQIFLKHAEGDEVPFIQHEGVYYQFIQY